MDALLAKIPADVTFLLQRLRERGYRGWVVGDRPYEVTTLRGGFTPTVRPWAIAWRMALR